MHQSDAFLPAGTVPKEDLGGGIARQILGYDDVLMLVRIWMEKNAEGTLHAHLHSQVTYVESGVFRATIGSETRKMQAGDCLYIAPNTTHGVVCVEAGVLVDTFSPIREDFLPKKQVV